MKNYQNYNLTFRVKQEDFAFFSISATLIWVSQHFNDVPAHFICKNLIRSWNIESPEYFSFLYAQFFFIRVVLLVITVVVYTLFILRLSFWVITTKKEHSS